MLVNQQEEVQVFRIGREALIKLESRCKNGQRYGKIRSHDLEPTRRKQSVINSQQPHGQ